jgi:hypothetical protein
MSNNNDQNTFKRLRIYNAVMGVFHLIQGIVMLYLANDFKLPITTNYLEFNPVARTALPQTETLFNLEVGPVVASFLFMSAVAHFFLVIPGVNNWYNENLSKKVNYARWIEYAFSSSVMIVVIGLLCGIFDFSSLFMLFVLNASMNLWGMMMEVHNQTTSKTNWMAFIYGCIVGIAPWIVLALYFYGAVGDFAENIPAFVYWILGSLFFFFNSFAINMFLQYKQVGPWKNYLFGESMYILLSLVAKSALAWQVFGGTLRPQ